MARALIPFWLNLTATGSQDFRVVLHMCSNRTPGPGLCAEKNVARSLVPSGAVMSTSGRELVWPTAKLGSGRRSRNDRMKRCMDIPSQRTAQASAVIENFVHHNPPKEGLTRRLWTPRQFRFCPKKPVV